MRHGLKYYKKNVFNIKINFNFPYIKDIYLLVCLGFIVGFTNRGNRISYIYIIIKKI
jgi:hypothetical protein